MTPLLLKGYNNGFKPEDIPKTSDHHSAETLGTLLQHEWNRELKTLSQVGKPSLGKALFKMHRKVFVVALGFSFIRYFVIRSLQAVFLGWVVRFFSGNAEDCVDPWSIPSPFGDETACINQLECTISATGIVLTQVLLVVLGRYCFHCIEVDGLKLKVAVSTIVYRKILNLSPLALSEISVGKTVNLLAIDVNTIYECVPHLPYIIIAPLHVMVVNVVIWPYLGIASLAGSFMYVLFTALQAYSAWLTKKIGVKAMVESDKRCQLINEIVVGIKTIKMCAWEKSFQKLVEDIRKKEMGLIRKSLLVRCYNSCLLFGTTKVVTVVVFALFMYLTGGPLTAEKAFVTMVLYGTLRISATAKFSMALSTGGQLLVALERLQKFLLLEEIQNSIAMGHSACDSRGAGGARLRNATAYWTKGRSEPAISDINLETIPGELLAIVGSVASGKSSLLMALLGELPLSNGTAELNGRVAYVSQNPWIFNDDVRSNILFGKEFQEPKYRMVIHVCALQKDLEDFPRGDETLVGERGIRLSGGQKARISLARALYSEADVYLFDDPLSALDAGVAKHVFNKCINGYLKGKTRILVTHQLQFLGTSNRILILQNGNCVAIGKPQEISKSGLYFSCFLKSSETKEERVMDSWELLDTTSKKESDIKRWTNKAVEDMCNKPKTSAARVYWSYVLKQLSPVSLFFYIIFYFTSISAFFSTDVWLKVWTSYESRPFFPNTTWNTTSQDCTDSLQLRCQSSWVFFGIYVALCAFVMITWVLRFGINFEICLKCSTLIHSSLVSSVIHSPLKFFDDTYIGRILNVMTRDTGIVDQTLPYLIVITLHYLAILLGALILIVAVQPYHLIPDLLLLVLMVWVSKLYIPTAVAVKRLEASSRSPVYSHISNSLQGLQTIRAFRAQQNFETTFYSLQDIHTSCGYLSICSSSWSRTLTDWITVVYIAGIIAVLVPTATDGASVGLAISTAIFVILLSNYVVLILTDLQNQMVSVERIDELCNLEPELDCADDPKPPSDWPEQGGITFCNVTLTYRLGDPAALNNLSCCIKPQEKVGIVGRTGAGKSSMIAALFRTTEPEGRIYIDGLDTKKISLSDLRSKMTIIPQDPVLFKGTVRLNLDRFGDTDDSVLWDALEEVRMKEAVNALPGGLNAVLTEGGSNFSVGQRQLICLARAILRKNNILVLDEATANIDNKTDALIQMTIREKFQHCTILTIAHRLNTVMDSDRVLVLGSGSLQEFDEPMKLLQDKNSMLYNLIQKTGADMADYLADLAARSRNTRQAARKYPGYNHRVGDKYTNLANKRIENMIGKINQEEISRNNDGVYIQAKALEEGVNDDLADDHATPLKTQVLFENTMPNNMENRSMDVSLSHDCKSVLCLKDESSSNGGIQRDKEVVSREPKSPLHCSLVCENNIQDTEQLLATSLDDLTCRNVEKGFQNYAADSGEFTKL